MERKIKLILKGMLFYVTSIVAFIYVAGIDSIYDNGYFLVATVVVASLIYICYKNITEEEFNIFCGEKLFEKYMEDEDDEL